MLTGYVPGSGPLSMHGQTHSTPVLPSSSRALIPSYVVVLSFVLLVCLRMLTLYVPAICQFHGLMICISYILVVYMTILINAFNQFMWLECEREVGRGEIPQFRLQGCGIIYIP